MDKYIYGKTLINMHPLYSSLFIGLFILLLSFFIVSDETDTTHEAAPLFSLTNLSKKWFDSLDNVN